MYSGDEQDAWDIPYLPTLQPACRRSPIPYLPTPNTPMLPYPTPPVSQTLCVTVAWNKNFLPTGTGTGTGAGTFCSSPFAR